MKKIFLLGTMLGVASAALAFGGMFNHGSKSTTYKGGVDAIGVHFGGEKKTSDSQPEEPTCPAEKQCGDYCCQGDNVCKQETGECCSEELNYCCPSGQTPYCSNTDCQPQPWCCSGKVYCEVPRTDGSCAQSSCCNETGKEVVCNQLFGFDACSCCPQGQKAYLHFLGYYTTCCVGEVYCSEYNENGNCIAQTCCPEGAIGYFDGDCCLAGNMAIEDVDKNTHCCPAGSPGYSWDDGCCEAGQKILDGHCCPADSTGWGGEEGCCESGTQPTEDPDGETHCCPTAFFDEDNWECCPEGTTGINDDGECINEGELN